MNLLNRLTSRIKCEGICKTLQYTILTCYYILREMLYVIYLDMKYSGRLLNGNIKTSNKCLGSNDVYHSKYSVLPIIFKLIPIQKKDVLVDIGCGKGRIINFWLDRYKENKIIGLELDKNIARRTRLHLSKWKNVSIITGDAIKNIPPDGTIFYFYNPFSKEVVEKFEKKMRNLFQNKSIKIIYYNPKSIDVFHNDKWKIKYINFEKDLGYKKWGRLNKYHDLAIIQNKLNS